MKATTLLRPFACTSPKHARLWTSAHKSQVSLMTRDGTRAGRSQKMIMVRIGVARGGQGRAFALPSLNFALPSKVAKQVN